LLQSYKNTTISESKNKYLHTLSGQTDSSKKRNKRHFVANPWQKKTPPWGEHLKKGQAEPKLK